MNVTRTGSVIRTLGLVNTLRGQSFFTILTSRWDKMSTLEERRIGAVVGALVADAAGILIHNYSVEACMYQLGYVIKTAYHKFINETCRLKKKIQSFSPV